SRSCTGGLRGAQSGWIRNDTFFEKPPLTCASVHGIHIVTMKDLTLRQQEILGFIQLHHREHGYWPSIRDIQLHFNFASTNAVMGQLRALDRKGAISRVPGQARAFRVTHDPQETPPVQAFDVVDIPVYGNIAAGYPDGVEPGGEIGRLQIDVNTAGI